MGGGGAFQEGKISTENSSRKVANCNNYDIDERLFVRKKLCKFDEKNARFEYGKNAQRGAKSGTKTKSIKHSAVILLLWLLAFLTNVTFGFINVPLTDYSVTAADTIIEISDEAGLTAIATAVNSGNDFYVGKTVQMTSNITITSTSWEGIGKYISSSSSYEFKGTFDGQMHTLYINIESESKVNGLFYYLGEGAVLKNLTIESTTKYLGFSFVNSANGTASNPANIFNCKNKANISSFGNAGGIAMSATLNTNIDSCANFGSVSGSIGYGCSSYGIAGGGNITNCYNMGDVTAAGNSTVEPFIEVYAVGIGGDNVKNCFSVCTLGASAKKEKATATTYAITKNTAENCYFKGTRTEKSTTVTREETGVTIVTSGSDLYEKSKAAGWDYSKIWGYTPTEENLFPYLRATDPAAIATYKTTFKATFTNDTPKGGLFLYILRDNESGDGYAEFYTYYFDGKTNSQSIVYDLNNNDSYRVVISKPYVWEFSISGTDVADDSFVNNKYTFRPSSDTGVVSITATGGTPPNSFTVI